MIPRIKPIGVADLNVVKQRLHKYEAGEIAHIENIMAGEHRDRSHRRLRQNEEFTSLEEERSSESEKNLESTERFELQKEAQKTIKSQTKFEAGVEVSGGFGPIKFSAHAGFSMSNSSEELQKEASNYSKEVIEKSVEKIKERVRQQSTRRVLEEFEETNTHGFENRGTDSKNISGVYKWLDKLYLTKVATQGKRLFYEFIIPQPASYYLYKEALKKSLKDLPQKPMFPQIYSINDHKFISLSSPWYIRRENYIGIKTGLNQITSTGIKPPPAKTVVVAQQSTKDLPKSPETGLSRFLLTGEVNIPKGYLAKRGFISINSSPNYSLFSMTGIGIFTMGRNYSYQALPSTYVLHEESDKVPYSLKYSYPPISTVDDGPFSISINVEVECELSDELYQKWQIETYDAVMQDYNRSLLDYEEKLTEIAIQEDVAIGGNNPLINREIEKNELKRSCIALWLGNNDFEKTFLKNDLDESIEYDKPPKIRINESLENASLIKFFETAFDWKNMAYELYPSYWSTNVTLDEPNNFGLSKIEIDSIRSTDTLFEAFLKAGSSRVLVPVELEASAMIILMNLLGTRSLDYRSILPPGTRLDILLEDYLKTISGWESFLNNNPDYFPPDGREEIEGWIKELKINDAYYSELLPYLKDVKNITGVISIDPPNPDPDIKEGEEGVDIIRIPTNLIQLQPD